MGGTVLLVKKQSKGIVLNSIRQEKERLSQGMVFQAGNLCGSNIYKVCRDSQPGLLLLGFSLYLCLLTLSQQNGPVPYISMPLHTSSSPHVHTHTQTCTHMCACTHIHVVQTHQGMRPSSWPSWICEKSSWGNQAAA